jgi:hypothetical protein
MYLVSREHAFRCAGRLRTNVILLRDVPRQLLRCCKEPHIVHPKGCGLVLNAPVVASFTLPLDISLGVAASDMNDQVKGEPFPERSLLLHTLELLSQVP